MSTYFCLSVSLNKPSHSTHLLTRRKKNTIKIWGRDGRGCINLSVRICMIEDSQNLSGPGSALGEEIQWFENEQKKGRTWDQHCCCCCCWVWFEQPWLRWRCMTCSSWVRAVRRRINSLSSTCDRTFSVCTWNRIELERSLPLSLSLSLFSFSASLTPWPHISGQRSGFFSPHVSQSCCQYQHQQLCRTPLCFSTDEPISSQKVESQTLQQVYRVQNLVFQGFRVLQSCSPYQNLQVCRTLLLKKVTF